MDRMVRTSRHARAAAATVTAVAGMLAGALALPAVRRQLPRVFAVSPELADVEPTPAGRPEPAKSDVNPPVSAERTLAASAPASAERRVAEATPADDSGKPSRSRRALAFVRRGATATVLVLLVPGIVIGAVAWHLRPDSAIPQPGSSNIDVAFGPSYVASSPIHVQLQLWQDEPVDGGGPTRVVLGIDISGKDVTYSGLTLTASVPNGVQLIPASEDNPSTGHVTRYPGTGDIVTITSRAVRSDPKVAPDEYGATLTWDNLHSGPIQVRGANLVAAFPSLTMSGGYAIRSVTLTDDLVLGQSDYAFLAGLTPDHESVSEWSWNRPADITLGVAVQADPLKIEARSATVDEQSHSTEFLSGILFGVAAAALVPALQEFMNSARKRKPAADVT